MSSDPATSFPPDLPERDSAATRSEPRIVNTKGGDYAEGNIDKRQGTFVEIAEERAYSVAGMPNPYLGLRAFTEVERDIFAGRERMVRALVERLGADDGDRLLFLIGASGSGKSSLARAGLLPALTECFASAGYTVQSRIVEHPGHIQATSLARILQDIQATPATSSPRMFLILIDQFEEIFSRAGGSEGEQTLDLLANLATETDLPLRIIATMRSDFLPQLVADTRYEAYEQRKVIVRAMSEDELRDAIQRPVQVRYPDKRFEPALLKRLTHDATADASYLPLLQLTLEDLWRGGDLRLGAYHGIADAIQRRADTVYTYCDYDEHSGLQQQPRTPEAQAIILSLFLDLVRVSLNNEQRDVRWRRTRGEIIQGDPEREQLVGDLTVARLLRTDREAWIDNGSERIVETVDIVHEAVLSGWPTLSAAIDAERETLRRRVRFDLALTEWCGHERRDEYLLMGARLSESEALKQSGDRIFHQPDAQEFYDRSIQQRDAERQRELAQVQALANERHRAVNRLRQFVTVLVVFLLVAVALGLFALDQQRAAEENARETQAQQRVADSNRLAVLSKDLLNAETAEQSLLFAIEAVQVDDNSASRQALQSALEKVHYKARRLTDETIWIESVAVSPDGQTIFAGSTDGQMWLWDSDGRLRTSLQGHTGRIYTAVFSPDSRRILTTSEDTTARLWDTNGTLLTTLNHRDLVWRAAFSPDGKYMLTASRDGTAQLLDMQGNLLATLSGSMLGVDRVLFSPDSRNILTVSAEIVQLWDTSGRSITTLPERYNRAVFSPDGRQILTSSSAGTAQLWNTQGELLVTFSGHTDSISSVGFSPDGTRILTASWDDTARLWDTTGQHLATLSGHTGKIERAVFSPDGRRILTVAEDYTVRLWDTEGTLLDTLWHDRTVTEAAFSPDGQRILTGSNGGAWLWAIDPIQPVTAFPGHDKGIWHVAFSPDGKHFLTASWDDTARLWDTQKQTSISFEVEDATVNSVAFSPDSQRVLVGSSDGVARLWDTEGALLATFEGHTGEIKSAVFSPDGKRILTGSADHTARLWDEAGQLLVTFAGHETGVVAKFSPDGRRILTISEGAILRSVAAVWLWDTGGERRGILHSARGRASAVFSPDSRYILTVTGGLLSEGAWLWDSDGELVSRLDASEISGMAFSPDSQRFLIASNSTIGLWNIKGEQITTLQGHTDKVYNTTYSPDGRYILTSSSDGTARLWSAEGQPITTLKAQTGSITSAAFSPDGRRIMTGSSDGTVRLWPVDLADWLAVATCRVRRALYASEIRDYEIPEPVHFDLNTRTCPPHFSWES